jgi:hypothetical protein
VGDGAYSMLSRVIIGSVQALIHGLNRHYYSLLINYRKNELEERMLLNLSKKGWYVFSKSH